VHDLDTRDVIAVVQNDLKPNIGRVTRLIAL
jgi:hypothetical protein